MLTHAHHQGRVDALAAYGCEKVAIDWATLGQRLKPDFSSWPGRFKRFAIGEPSLFYEQLKNNQLFREGGLLRNVFHPGKLNTTNGKVNAALMYGMPLVGLYQAATSAPGQRGASVGQFLGGTAGSFLGSPLGIVGQMGGNFVLGQLGQTLGAHFNARRLPEIPHQQEYASPPLQRIPDKHPALSGQMADVTGRPAW